MTRINGQFEKSKAAVSSGTAVFFRAIFELANSCGNPLTNRRQRFK
jgi:hypothetical protein